MTLTHSLNQSNSLFKIQHKCWIKAGYNNPFTVDPVARLKILKYTTKRGYLLVNMNNYNSISMFLHQVKNVFNNLAFSK